MLVFIVYTNSPYRNFLLCIILFYRTPGKDSLLICLAIESKPLVLKPFLEMLTGHISFQNISDEHTTIHLDLE